MISGKLSAWQRTEIARRYAEGESSVVLAAEFGVNKASVVGFARRRGGSIRPMGRPRQYTISETAFNTVTEESAYWIGMIMADGCVVDRGKDVSLGISLSGEDGHHLERLRAFLQADAPVRWCENPGPKGWNGRRCARFFTYSRPVVESLARYGITPRKSATARVIGLENDRHFWRGVIDGDGSLCLTRRGEHKPKPVMHLVGSEPLVNQFATFARKHVTTNARVVRAVNQFAFTLSCRNCLVLARALYDPCTVALPRKLATAQKFLTSSLRSAESDQRDG